MCVSNLGIFETLYENLKNNVKELKSIISLSKFAIQLRVRTIVLIVTKLPLTTVVLFELTSTHQYISAVSSVE